MDLLEGINTVEHHEEMNKKHGLYYPGPRGYMNLVYKTVHMFVSLKGYNIIKSDVDALVNKTQLIDCLSRCSRVENCYVGSMHVKMNTVADKMIYTFATGEGYFVGKELVDAIASNESKLKYDLDSIDFGEDKHVGFWLNFLGVPMQVLNCKFVVNLPFQNEVMTVHVTKHVNNASKQK